MPRTVSVRNPRIPKPARFPFPRLSRNSFLDKQVACYYDSGYRKNKRGVHVTTAIKDTFALLRLFAIKHKTPVVDFPFFQYFVQRHAERSKGERPSLAAFLGDTQAVLTEQLTELARGELCRLEYEGDKIRKISFPYYYIDVVNGAYRRLESNPELPFPTRESLDTKLPDDVIHTVDISRDFLEVIEHPDRFKYSVLRLTFPDNIRDILCTTELVMKKLIEHAVYKIRLYLNTQRNADYVRHKLLVVFQNRDLILKDTLDQIIMKPTQIAASIASPSDFMFSFWAHLSNFIIQEYRQKETKLTDEHGYCQAAYLLGLYNALYKGRVQREKNEDTALRALLGALKVAPYARTLGELLNLKDKNGLRIAKNVSNERLQAFLEERIVPERNKAVPLLIRKKTADGQIRYIHREVLFQLILRLLTTLGPELRQAYTREWADNLRQYKKTPEMQDDAAFRKHLEDRVRSEQPLLSALLDQDLLAVARREIAYPADLSLHINSLFSDTRGMLKPIDELLMLHRKELFDAARLQLSFWELLPSFRKLRAFLRRLFAGFRKGAAGPRGRHEADASSSGSVHGSSASVQRTAYPMQEPFQTTKKAVGQSTALGERSKPDTKQDLQTAYNAAVLKLRETVVGKGVNLEQSLHALAEKWNPLYDETAKRNLVEDTNAMIRDYYRTLRRAFRIKPPDAARLQSLAETFADNQAFVRIKKKQVFIEYVKLYLIRLLGEK